MLVLYTFKNSIGYCRKINLTNVCISDAIFCDYIRSDLFLCIFAPKQDCFPMMSVKHAIQWLYPYSILLGHEGKMAVEDVLKVSVCPTSFCLLSSSISSFLISSIFLSQSFFLFLLSIIFLSRHGSPDGSVTRKQSWETRAGPDTIGILIMLDK